MSRPKKFTVKQMVDAICNTGGIKSEICKRCKCDLRTFNAYLAEYPEVKEAYEDETEKVLDMAEGALFSQVQNGELSAIFYYLNNKGASRGYGPRADQVAALAANADEESGVLIAPGILSESEWEKEAAK